MRVAVELRRLRGELRRFLHPMVIGAVLLVAAAACAAQRQVGTVDAHAPSLVDLTGSLRIALQHHATGLGFLLAGIGAGWTSGEDARIGAIGTVLLADHRGHRVWLRRVTALLVLSVLSIAVSAAALHLTRGATACMRGCAESGRSNGNAVLADTITAAAVIVFAAALCVAIALAVRSEVLVAVIALAIFLVPANHAGDVASWVTPTKWIAQAMRFEPAGSGSDYSGGKAAYDPHGWLTVTALILLVAATGVLARLGTSLLERRGGEGAYDG